MQRGDQDGYTRLKISLWLPLVAVKQSTSQCDSHFKTQYSHWAVIIDRSFHFNFGHFIVWHGHYDSFLVIFCYDLVIVTVISPHTTVIVGHCDCHCDISDSIGDSIPSDSI